MTRRRLRLDRNGWDAFWIAVASCAVAWVFYRNAMLMSRVIDGERLFTIDDDMMISMTYARNLAEGHGLIWVAGGDHVEGYTNFLWTLVMAGVHACGAADARAANWVRGCSFVCLVGALIQSVRLLRVLVPRGYIVTPLLLGAIIASTDVTPWAVWGFETTLLTFFFMTFVLSLMRDPMAIVGWVALALIPLTRSDGIQILATCAGIAFLMVEDRKRLILTRIIPAGLPVVAHFLFRKSYYGDWLPNTYYLKVYLLDDVHLRGYHYARNFLVAYAIPITLAAAAMVAIGRRNRRAFILLPLVGLNLVYLLQVGGDMMGGFRFCAHLMPLIYVFAAASFAHVAKQGWVVRTAWGLVTAFATIPLQRPLDRLTSVDNNGAPQDQMQVAMLIKKNALPDSVVAVIAAGIVPYFSRHRVIDLFGKADRHIARLPPFPGSLIGHGKIDPEYSFAQKPDLVVSLRANSWIQGLNTPTINTDSYLGVLSSATFYKRYRVNLVTNDFTNEVTAIYAFEGSPEAARRTSWQPLVVKPAPR